MRPLDRLRSIKLKIGVLVVGSVLAAMTVFAILTRGLPWRTGTVAVVLALVVTQVIAHGMTSPLREMTTAARAMARGDYTRRVRATSRDEVGELARAFNQMAADLDAADRHRRELIANVSHELRTPISALQAVLENVVDGVSDPSTLEVALARTERLGRLVNELLDLSRIDAGVLPLSAERFLVRAFLDEVVGEATFAGRPTDFAIAVVPDTLTVVADRARLYQVLMNLVDNACRHGPPGGVVTLAAAPVRAGGVAIEVADDGPGIPPEERRRVFERFTRGGRTSDGGTGLGLAIARWVVELHGGTIAVVDDHDPGCRIRVQLP